MNKVSLDLQFKGKNILIMGLGINQGGIGATRFFANSEANVKVTDLKTAEDLKDSIKELEEFSNIEYVLGEHKFEDFDWADLVLKNADVRPGNKYINYALEKGKRVETDVSLFLKYVNRDLVIGITGTKGKSTTSTLVYEILRKTLNTPLPSPLLTGEGTSQLNPKVLLAGNIGKSMLDMIAHVDSDSVVILELSSAQLTIFDQNKLSIKRGAVTNIHPDHISYHGSMEEYVKAKRAVAAYQKQGDLLFLRKNDATLTSEEFTHGLKAEIIYSDTNEILTRNSNGISPVQDDSSKLPEILQLEHNLENFAQAAKISQSFGVAMEDIYAAVKDFQGVEFRQQVIKVWNGIKIINDSAGSTPTAAMQALKTYPQSIFIIGGMNKDLDYADMAAFVDQYAKSVYLFEGTATDDLKQKIKKQELIKGEWHDFEEMLEEIKKEAKDGDTIVLAPGGTSFNYFQSQYDRGRKFNAAVEKVFN